MPEAGDKDLHGLVEILLIRKKSELRKHLRQLVVRASDFSLLILACEAGILPWGHQISYRDFVPDHLRPVVEGHLDEQSISKLPQFLRERRYLVGHMFIDRSMTNWHFFYFDQRDVAGNWAGGSHIHFINYLWPNENAEGVWRHFNDGNPHMTGALHVRFARDQ